MSMITADHSLRGSMRFAALISLCVTAAACAPTLETPNDEFEDDGTELCPIAEPVCSAEFREWTMQTHVNASDSFEWVYFDFDTMTAPTIDDPRDSLGWDLAFRRFVIKVNGGVSGTGGVEFAIVEELNFSELTLPPLHGEWLTDQPDDEEDPDLDPEYLMATGPTGWFDYDFMTHVLTPRERIYVVRSTEGDYYKLQMITYYDSAGSPAHIRFNWGILDNP